MELPGQFERFAALRHRAVDLHVAGDPAKAVELLVQAANELRPLLDGMPPGAPAANDLHELLFQMLVDIGVCGYGAENYELSAKGYDYAFSYLSELAQRYPGVEVVNPKNLGWAMGQRANTKDRMGRPEEALADYRAAIPILETAAERDPDAAREHQSVVLNLGVTLLRIERAGEALPYLEWVAAERAKALAPDTRDAFGQRSVAADWEPRHRLAFAQHVLSQALARLGRRDAVGPAAAAHDSWKRMVEEEGHAHLAQYLSMAQRNVAGL